MSQKIAKFLKNAEKIWYFVLELLVSERCEGVKILEISKNVSKNETTFAIGGVDTEANEHCEVCALSVYRSPRCPCRVNFPKHRKYENSNKDSFKI